MVLGFTWLGFRVGGFWPMSLGSWQGKASKLRDFGLDVCHSKWRFMRVVGFDGYGLGCLTRPQWM